MIPALDPDPESDFKPFDDSGSGLDPVKTGIVTNLVPIHSHAVTGKSIKFVGIQMLFN